MASKDKVDSGVAKREKRKADNFARKVKVRTTREYFLIVCEGEQTEPNYFEGLKRDLQKGTVDLKILGLGANTLSLVRKAILADGRLGRIFDQVWVVFDRDSFPPGTFNDAILVAKKAGFNVAYSNEAFELWYLLHFEYYDTGISRDLYWPKLERYLGVKYEKNSTEMYELLKSKGNQTKAIRNAQNLYNRYNHTSPEKENPSTTVHLLVTELNKFKRPIVLTTTKE